jgi:hypothetical protein
MSYKMEFKSIKESLATPIEQLISIDGRFKPAFAKRDKKQTMTELVFLNVYGAPESIPRNEFRQPM